MKEHLTILYIIMMALSFITLIKSFFSKKSANTHQKTITTFILAYISEIIIATALISALISFIFSDTFNYLPSENHLETFAQSYAIYQILIIVILQVRANQKKEGIFVLKSNLEKVKLALNHPDETESSNKLLLLTADAQRLLPAHKRLLPYDVYKQYENLIYVCEELIVSLGSTNGERASVIKNDANFDFERYLIDIETEINKSGLIWSSSLLLFFKKNRLDVRIERKKYL